MDHSILTQSLQILSETYGSEIAEYVRRVIKSESKSTELEPEEVVSIAYIVLDRATKLYDTSRGDFKNYAIRSLKNEFVRSKVRDFLLYDDPPDSDISPLMNVASEKGLFSKPGNFDETVTEAEYSARTRELLYLSMAASLLTELTPLQKCLVYYVYYSTDSTKTQSLRPLADATALPIQTLTTSLKRALDTIRQRVSS